MFEYSLKDGFLTEGSVVIFPTDTVFGIACRLYDNNAVERIINIKGRDKSKHLGVLCDTLVTVNDLAVIDERALKLAHKFWPGPLTLVLNSSESHYNKSGHKTVGVRIPDHDGVIRLIKQNGPLVTTSVNYSGKDPITNTEEITKEFGDKVDHIYKEYNMTYLNVSSTTVDLTNKEPVILREGTIRKQEIIEALK